MESAAYDSERQVAAQVTAAQARETGAKTSGAGDHLPRYRVSATSPTSQSTDRIYLYERTFNWGAESELDDDDNELLLAAGSDRSPEPLTRSTLERDKKEGEELH